MEQVINASRPVGFFDSGVGGLSVLKEFKELLPNEETIYFGDIANLPYGNKSKEQLIGFARKILSFFKEKDVKAVVIACNTSSAQAYDTVKDEFDFKIYPIIQSCAKVIAKSGAERIGVFATEATVKAGKYTQELLKYNPNLKILELASKDWVSIVEGTAVDMEKSVKKIKEEMDEMLEFRPDKIILGCTHYPYLMHELEKYAPKELFINPAKIFAEYIKSDLTLSNLNKKGNETFYVSANPKDFVKNAKMFYEIKNFPKNIQL